MAEAAGRHGLSPPLRTAVYAWFDRWLAGRQDAAPVVRDPRHAPPRRGIAGLPRRPGQPLAAIAALPAAGLGGIRAEAEAGPRARSPNCSASIPSRPTRASPRSRRIAGPARPSSSASTATSRGTGERKRSSSGAAASRRPCGRGGRPARRRVRPAPSIFAKAPHYADPLSGAEENIAYNAFLVGKCLLGMRVADVLAAIARLAREGRVRTDRPLRPPRRGAGGLPGRGRLTPWVDQVACEDMLLSFRPLFTAEGLPINAASILPGLLQKFGDVADVLAQIAPRKVLVASGNRRAVQARTARADHPARFLQQGARLLRGLAPSHLNAADRSRR